MKIRPIIIGLAASMILPLAASAGAVFEPGLIQAGAGIELERGLAPAENFGRSESDGSDDCKKGDENDHCHKKCNDGDRDDKGDKGDKNHNDCDRSPSKPR